MRCCYLIAAGDTDRVKIGWAADVDARIRALQAGCWEPLRVLRTWDGGRELETRLHKHFASLRIAREWFRFDPSMLSIDAAELPVLNCIISKKPSNLPIIRLGPRGSLAKLADDLGLTRGAVAKWHHVPADRVGKVAKLLGVSYHDLRPDLFPERSAAE